MWRSGELKFKASPGTKVARPHLNQWLDEVACARHPIYSESTKRKTVVQAGPEIK
jgi:hypothetical protein